MRSSLTVSIPSKQRVNRRKRGTSPIVFLLIIEQCMKSLRLDKWFTNDITPGGKMKKNKKYWFRKVSPTLWVPISWEGWVTIGSLILVLFFIYKTNDISSDVALSFSIHGPMLIELVFLIVLFFGVTYGHVKK